MLAPSGRVDGLGLVGVELPGADLVQSGLQFRRKGVVKPSIPGLAGWQALHVDDLSSVAGHVFDLFEKSSGVHQRVIVSRLVLDANHKAASPKTRTAWAKQTGSKRGTIPGGGTGDSR